MPIAQAVAFNRRGRTFDELTDGEILALAISSEENASRTYLGFADELREEYPDSARMFTDMAKEEDDHRRRLLALFQRKFGEVLPFIRWEDVRGIRQEVPSGTAVLTGAEAMRRQARGMEANASRFYHLAASHTRDAAIRAVLGDLAIAEAAHEHTAGEIDEHAPPTPARQEETETARRNFILRVVQPGLVGLMDGSVSTLAPVFAAAFATHNSWDAFRVGMAASIGAGISMGFAEALADDGKLSGRGTPLLRGVVCGLMTVAGGIGHTLPYLIPDFLTATVIAGIVAAIELIIIAWVQWRYMDTPPISAGAKVMLGGALVLAAGILIGSG
ncbi:MAG: rubrerythrin [Acidisphaera sp.]|nr:rubrerythrin [Acidisphaera sp.]MBV9811439.1 rubrerythrin [Acetobacteraceae bacterium]